MTRLQRLVGALLWCALCAWGFPAAAQDAPADTPEVSPPAEARVKDLSLDQQVMTIWQERKAHLDAGMEELADVKISELESLKESLALQNFTVAANLLVYEGHQFLKAGETLKADEAFKKALELDPGCFEARLGLGSLARAKSDWVGLAADRIGGFFLKIRRFYPSYFLLLRVYAVVGLTLLATALMFFLVMAVKYNSLLRHDLFEALQLSIHHSFLAFLGWVILLLPILLAFDLFWAALWWAVLLFGYFSLREKIVAAVSLVVLLLAMPLLGLYASLLTPLLDRNLEARVQLREGTVEDGVVTALERHAEADPRDLQVRVLLANIFQKSGRFREAEAYYREALSVEHDPSAFNNLANIHYRLGEYDLAYQNWNEAIKAAEAATPALAAAPYYNLGIYYMEKYDFKLQSEYYEKARKLDPDLIQNFSSGGGNKVIDSLGAEDSPGRYALRQAWAAFTKDGTSYVLRPQSLTALVALALALAVHLRRRAHGYAVPCLKCGRPYCRKCNPNPQTREYCLQCSHLFIKKDGVSPQMRQDKLREIGRNQLIRNTESRVLSLLCPGAQDLLADRTVLGTALVLVWWALVSIALLGRRMMDSASTFEYTRAGLQIVVVVACMLVLWIGANVRFLLGRK